jgi:hypothetical protein
MIHNMNSRQPWRKWARFIIYAIALFVLVRLIKAIMPDSLLAKSSKPNQVPKNRGYKQQTILNYIPENDTLYYRDFPWYKAEHTRPQFSPNHTLLTQHLDSKQRQLVHDKAVTQAKQLALRKFPAHEYKGIRGSHWRDDDAASKDFRKKVDCWTTGEWVKDEKSLQLNHVQDPLYSSCDNKFYKTHEKDQKREAAQYSWKSNCPLKFNTISAPSWCKVMMGRHMLLVGDLVHYQFHDLLLDSFRDDPTVCFGELNCKGNDYI